jgi:carbon storage regulator
MLVLHRRIGEKIMIDGGNIVVTVSEINGDKVKLRIKAPRHVSVDREEIHRRKAMERKNGVAIRHQPECLLAGEINDGSVVCGCKSKQGFGSVINQ